MSRSTATVTICVHGARCECDDCTQELYDLTRRLFGPEQPDPADVEQRDRDFREWVESDPEPATEVWNG